MDGHSLYFVGYALIATISGVVIAQAQYSRKQNEGTKINFKILKLVFGIALLMWTGAALSTVYYTSSTTATAVSGIFVGIILSLFFGWQINRVIRKIQTDEKTVSTNMLCEYPIINSTQLLASQGDLVMPDNAVPGQWRPIVAADLASGPVTPPKHIPLLPILK